MCCDILAYTVSTYVYNVYLRWFTYTEIRNTTGVFVAVVKSGFLFELEFDWWLLAGLEKAAHFRQEEVRPEICRRLARQH